ncbi:unnamed protein product [Cyprideis torosa]|uniref:Uncharacterized protein n=1 Tax=Cyprideis torosa TaxID=163714 RepID=A0A7R8WLI1_9CRUS|nr:unnamed protein product [Cyprideis torosa]CAG0904377.1 unnamed protein product [Cyprideis torosa]
MASILVLFGLLASAAGLPTLKLRSPNKILGGEMADYGDYPYQISIQIWGGILGWQHVCGGSILNENWILTASHCNILNVIGQSDARVVAGFLTLLENDDEPTQQAAEVAEFIKHPDFIYESLTGYIRHDIALIRLATPLNLNAGPEVAAAVLPSSEDSFPVFDVEASCIASGWGTDGYGIFELPSNDLLWTNITAFTDEKCLEIWGDYTYAPVQMLCAGTYEGGHGVCSGDSGGPILCEAEDGSMVVFGVTSFGDISCGENAAYPEVWTEINHYLDWIQETAV